MRRETTRPPIGLIKQMVPDRGQLSSSISNSNSSLNTSSSSVSSGSMNANLNTIKKSGSTCIACSTELSSSSSSSSSSIISSGANPHRAHNGVSVGVSCGINGTNSITGAERSVSAKGRSPAGCSCTSRADGAMRSGRRLLDEEAGLCERGGTHTQGNAPRAYSVSFCVSSATCRLHEDSSKNVSGLSLPDINGHEGVESGYASLKKTRMDTEDAQSGVDTQHRCETAPGCTFTPPLPASRLPVFSRHRFDAVTRGRGDVEVWEGALEKKVEEQKKTTSRGAKFDHIHRTNSPGREEVTRLFGRQRRRSQVIDQFEKDDAGNKPVGEWFSSSSSSSLTAEHDGGKGADLQVCGQDHRAVDVSRTSGCIKRRSKSLERSLAEHTPTPDLLNFKKGWMTRLGEDGKWRKHWFVLTDQSLRFYRDSVAEEAADLDGEINLSTCYDITDFPVQKNYGFQIHTKDGVFTLCAMTYGIRRNWIQAVMKNVRPAAAPDVTWKNASKKSSSFSQKVPGNSVSGHKGPTPSGASCSEERRSRISERRKEGRYKTFDWSEFRRKQQKREELSRNLGCGSGSRNVCGESVPPAPASSPEDFIRSSVTEEQAEADETRIRERKLHVEMPHVAPPTTSSTPNHTDSHPCCQEGAVADDMCIINNFSSTQKVMELKEAESQTEQSISSTSSLASSSSSVQTDCQWEVELQTLRSHLKAEQERAEREERQLKVSESCLQTELNDSHHRLSETEARLQKAETALKEREDALEELRRCLEDITGRLKATEEAQALKDARLQRHLGLLQESQERERKSLGESLEHSEKRGKELEEQLLHMEEELQKTPMGGMVQELERRCQELQNQLEESECEVSRLQARLCDEETMYYDMEHDYERVCEELECVRSAMQDCERTCEERFASQLEKQQRELDRKEQELQEVLVKMAALGTSLEETERRLKEAQRRNSESSNISHRLTQQKGLNNGSEFRHKVKNGGFDHLEMHPVASEDESGRVVSVIQELESKLSNTEERLREITVHLQQQLAQDTHVLGKEKSSRKTQPTAEFLSADRPGDDLGTNHRSQAPHCPLEKTAATSEMNLEINGLSDFDFQRDLHEESEHPDRWLTLGLASRMLSLEALVVQRMASAVEQPSKELLQKLSDLQVKVKTISEAQNGTRGGAESYSQFLSYYQGLDESSYTVGKLDISNLCVRAEMAFLLHTLHLRHSEEQQGLKAFNHSPWPVSKAISLAPGAKPKLRLADISPPELAPYSEQIQESQEEEICPGDTKLQSASRESLAAELRSQARSLQALSGQLWHLNGDANMPCELPPPALRSVLCQATLAYVMSRMRLALQQELCSLREERERAVCECRAVCRSMETLFQEQTERYEEKLREDRVVIEMAELGRVSAETDAQIRGQEVQRLEAEFEEKLQELQRVHEEEMELLRQSQSLNSLEVGEGDESVSVSIMKERIRELESQVTCLENELCTGDANSLRQAYEQELETLKATCELGFGSMEQSHQRVIAEMQRQHEIEVQRLMEEKERVLQEETNATIAAIEAMRKAHKLELEKNQKVLQNGSSTDISQLCAQYNEELESLHRELEVLSEQYSQKCLENAQLSRTLETERQTLKCTERENQELHTRNHELNKCLVTELSIMQSYVNGGTEHTQPSQSRDPYQLEVTLRVKETEIQCLKQEISSLKEELQTANRHSKELLTELDAIGLKSTTDSPKSRGETYRARGFRRDLIKSRSNPDFQKDCSKRNTPTRSKSLRDGLSAQERMLLFESDNNGKI